MKVCIVAEGCYPYVVGGVSGWINSLIKSFPNVEFILLAIVANRSFRGNSSMSFRKILHRFMRYIWRTVSGKAETERENEEKSSYFP